MHKSLRNIENGLSLWFVLLQSWSNLHDFLSEALRLGACYFGVKHFRNVIYCHFVIRIKTVFGLLTYPDLTEHEMKWFLLTFSFSSYVMNPTEFVQGPSLSDYNLLLCWLCIHDDAKVSRCYPYFVQCAAVHPAYKDNVSEQGSTVWSGLSTYTRSWHFIFPTLAIALHHDVTWIY